MALRALKAVYRQWVIVPGISLLLTACHTKRETVPYYHTPDLTPVWYSKGSDTLHTIAAFQFTDQDGKSVSGKDMQGKVYVANFFYTRCTGICLKMTKNLKLVADSFKNNDKVAFLSYSVDPQNDSEQKLKRYTIIHEINNKQWHLLTGDKAAIYSLARRSYFAEEEIGYNADSSEFLHTEHVMLIDKDKHLRGVYNGTVQLEMERLMTDINELLKQ